MWLSFAAPSSHPSPRACGRKLSSEMHPTCPVRKGTAHRRRAESSRPRSLPRYVFNLRLNHMRIIFFFCSICFSLYFIVVSSFIMRAKAWCFQTGHKECVYIFESLASPTLRSKAWQRLSAGLRHSLPVFPEELDVPAMHFLTETLAEVNEKRSCLTAGAGPCRKRRR